MSRKNKISISKIMLSVVLIIISIVLISWIFLNIPKISNTISSYLENSFSNRDNNETSSIYPNETNFGEENTTPIESTENEASSDNLVGEALVEEPVVDTEEKVETNSYSGYKMVNIYFSDENGEYLVGELRSMPESNYLEQAIIELLEGPDADNLVSLIPSNAKLLGARIDNGIAKINFSKEFVENKLESDIVDRLTVYSIVNTVTEFDEINSVEIYIEGEKLNLYGSLDISEPVFREPLLIKKNE